MQPEKGRLSAALDWIWDSAEMLSVLEPSFRQGLCQGPLQPVSLAILLRDLGTVFTSGRFLQEEGPCCRL